MSYRSRIWLPIVVLYGLFFSWYTDFGGPVTEQEISQLTESMRANGSDEAYIDYITTFFREDTGRQFLMVNNIDANDSPPSMPGMPADADAEAVARGAAECFSNSGQSCDAPTRMLVERSIYDQAVATAVATAKATAVDRASKSGDHMGPVVSELQYNKIQTLIEKGIAEGARLAAGGPGRPEGLEKGYFVQPTVFADVDNSMTIAREEIFGPVLSMIPFDDETDALRIANDTTYGLTNYVQTQDQAKGQRLARRLRSGMVQMNGTGLGPRTPFGGMRQSGNGREGGVWGIEDFIEVKTVSGWN